MALLGTGVGFGVEVFGEGVVEAHRGHPVLPAGSELVKHGLHLPELGQSPVPPVGISRVRKPHFGWVLDQ